MDLTENLTAEEQAQFDAMRAADQPEASPVDTTAAPEPAQPASEDIDAQAAPQASAPAAGEADKKTVPLKTFLEERRKLEDRLAQEQKLRQTLEERTNLIIQRLDQPQQQKTEPTPIPDLATDPAGHILGTLKATGMSVEQLSQAMQQNTMRQRESEAIAELQTYAAATEQQYRAETPDYDSAVTFLIEKRNKLLEASGLIDPAQRLAQINREKLQLAHQARQAGKSPAAMAYEIAQIYGYAPQAPAAAAVVDPEPNAGAEKLERVAAGQQQGRSLSNTRGGAPPATPPAQRIAEMAPDKFAALLAEAEKNPEKMREIFGA